MISPLSIEGVRAALRRPTPQDWLASIKAYLAVALALAVGFSQNLDNPYWSALTVYVLVAQPQSGAMRSKSLFRLVGTIFGGCVAMALAGLFGNNIGVLLFVLAVFILGSLYLQQLDRTPSAYFWFASGLTAAVIGIVHLQAPQDFFTYATARMGEISLGIVAMIVVDSIFWPVAMTPAFLLGMEKWRDKARDWMTGAMDRPDQPLTPEQRWQRRLALRAMTAQLTPIDMAMVQLPYDIVATPARRQDVWLLRTLVSSLIGEFAVLGIWRRAVSRTEAPSAQLLEALKTVEAWIEEARGGSVEGAKTHAERGYAMAEAFAAEQGPLLALEGDSARVQAALFARLADLVREWAGLDLVLNAVRTRRSLPDHLARRRQIRPTRSRDYVVPLLDLAPMALSMLLTGAFWYFTAWASGLNALLFAFLGCFFLIGQPASQRATVGLLLWVSLAFVFTFTYLFVVLPRVTAYPVLIGVLGVAMIPLGVLATMSIAGLLIGSMGFSFLGLQNAYQADFGQSLLTLGGSFAGLLIAVGCIYVCRYDRPHFVARRLVRAVRLDVADAALGRRAPSRERFLSLCVDRLALFFSVAEGFDRNDPLNFVDMISDFRIGANLLTLRQSETHLSGEVRETLIALRNSIGLGFQAYAKSGEAPGGLLPDVDRCLDAVLTLGQEPDRERMVLALTGLRLALQPDASLSNPDVQAGA